MTAIMMSAASGAVTNVIQSISELETASREDYRASRRFDLTAQVISIRGKTVTLHDGTSGNSFRNIQYTPQPFREGDIVHVRGGLESGRSTWLFHNIRNLTVLGHKPLPPVKELQGGEINDVANRHRRVRMRGVLTSAIPDDTDPQYTWLTFSTASGHFTSVVSTNAYSREKLNHLIDAEIEASGVVVPFDGWRQNLGNYITPEHDDGFLRIIVPAPTDPFSAPNLGLIPSLHRQKTIGRVIAVGNECFYLQTREHPLLQIIPNDLSNCPNSGDTIEAVGFMGKSPFNPTLTDALTRPAAETAAELGLSSLKVEDHPPITNRPTRASTMLNGRLIRLRGSVERINYDPDNSFSLNVDGVEFRVETRAVETDTLRLEPGCQIEVTGLCTLQFAAPYSQAEFPHFNGFVLTPRTIHDLKIISQPPWWTPLRLSLVLVSLIIVIIGILIWNHSLRTLSERRARALTRERIAHAKTEVKIEERTRLAVELHDSISQMLTGVAMQLDSAVRAEQEKRTSTRQFLETAKRMLGSCRKELQECLWDLRSRTFAEHDMTEAVLRTLAPHTGNVQIDVRFNVPRKALSESAAHTILAIIRELCVNAIRHGHARHLRVAGECHDKTISFSVRDDGCGFDPARVDGPDTGHFGLSGVRERLAPYEGELSIESVPGHGSRLSAQLKIDRIENS